MAVGSTGALIRMYRRLSARAVGSRTRAGLSFPTRIMKRAVTTRAGLTMPGRMMAGQVLMMVAVAIVAGDLMAEAGTSRRFNA